MKPFEGKVALVTGATKGIGRATAVRLASESALVATLREIEEVGGNGFPVVAVVHRPSSRHRGNLAEMLRCTNAGESMISDARTTMRKVKHWRDGEMKKRWVAAGMLEAQRSFRRVRATNKCRCSSPLSAATPA